MYSADCESIALMFAGRLRTVFRAELTMLPASPLMRRAGLPSAKAVPLVTLGMPLVLLLMGPLLLPCHCCSSLCTSCRLVTSCPPCAMASANLWAWCTTAPAYSALQANTPRKQEWG
jgi:hypothetical protein